MWTNPHRNNRVGFRDQGLGKHGGNCPNLKSNKACPDQYFARRNEMDAYQKMAVIFIDLLGTKNNKRFEDKLLIHRIFHEEARANEKRNMQHVIYERKVYSFSDCAYIFYYYKPGIEDDRKNDMNLVYIAMYNTSLSLLRIMNAGYLVRGGIAFGDAYFDELGFFGPAVEEAYGLESGYADVPIVALEPKLGKAVSDWEDSQTSQELVKLLMTSRPRVVEYSDGKYFMNPFYSLERAQTLILESGSIEMDEVKQNLYRIIARDKVKYGNQKSPSRPEEKKATIYEKLDWFEQYMHTKHLRLKPEHAPGSFSQIYTDD